jgi:hypothetical protein
MGGDRMPLPGCQVNCDQIKPAEFPENGTPATLRTNLETLLGTLYRERDHNGDRQRGHIDTLGLDRTAIPIVEYKK